MRKIIITLGLALLVCTSAMAQVPSDTNLVKNDSLLAIGMDMALKEMLLTRGDFAFRDDYTAKDPYRLKIVDSLMSRPILMADFAENFTDVMRNFGSNSEKPLHILNQIAGWEEVVCCLLETYVNYRTDLISKGGQVFNAIFVHMMYLDSYQKVNLTCCLVDTQEEFLKNKYPELILDDPDYRKWTNEQLDSMQHLEEEMAIDISESGVNIPFATIDIRSVKLLDSLLLQLLPQIDNTLSSEVQREFKNNKIPDIYKVVIGTEGNDTYTGDYFMILDPGGDDIYNLSYDINNPHPVILADFGGDDYYNAQTDFALACGALDFSLLIDYDGDDIYKAKNFGLGAGYFGVGILWDKKGNDRYFGDTFVEGAGTFGYGLLIDEDGSDTYTANLQSQGFGFVKGIGGIADYNGNDAYIIEPKYKEYFHTGNHYTSLSQGFGIGIRPYMSGGFGFICDYGGNDSYIADFFAQASSYWWSLGMIYDKWGNDLYSTYQYAQGAGAHMTLGILIDGAGDDVYRSHGVCQGCGHDYSCGWLIDKSGNDVYTAHDLAQGAGQANGIGIFNDLGGDDGYYTHNKHNTQGYGNPRRDYGSIGIFTDMGGDDRFQGNGANNTIWRVPGKWGLGLDWEPPKPDTTEEGEGE